ncbi:cysteine hydrolase family protein [Yinghuangia seranimata]|uniref:cysteine hydrolase family protein n=1 Tax=Yinghuangia seranimata TaxID=408067 RepID=UPI00248BEB02|nr:isochorismatase family cysteine hydrolase [Yinghuangia seranimata]MDI2129843.1 isochorismatase family cysteine hydrolase [Yinghuangia seranimata]
MTTPAQLPAPLDPRHTALVLVDLMPRIVDLPGLAPHSGADTLATCLDLAAAFRTAGAPVAAIRVDRPNVAEQPPGSELHPDVEKLADAVFVKRSIGGFTGTGLREWLAERGVTHVVYGGIATNLGVESTARAASDHGLEAVFVEDAMTGLTAAEHEAAVTLDMPRFGDVVAATDVRLEAASDSA